MNAENTKNGLPRWLGRISNSTLAPIVVALVVVSVVLSIMTPNFLTASNLTNNT